MKSILNTIDGITRQAIVQMSRKSKFKKGYFLSGIEYDEEIYNEIMKEREGLPWYKQSAPKGETYRN